MILNFLPIEKNIASRICMMLIVGYMFNTVKEYMKRKE